MILTLIIKSKNILFDGVVFNVGKKRCVFFCKCVVLGLTRMESLLLAMQLCRTGLNKFQLCFVYSDQAFFSSFVYASNLIKIDLYDECNKMRI